MSKGSEAIEKVHALQADLKKLSGQASGAVADAITALDKQVAAVAGQAARWIRRRGGGARGAAPMTLARLDGEYGSLFASIDSADAAPTMPQNEALQELNAELHQANGRLEQRSRTQDVPALNQQLQKAGLPPIEMK